MGWISQVFIKRLRSCRGVRTCSPPFLYFRCVGAVQICSPVSSVRKLRTLSLNILNEVYLEPQINCLAENMLGPRSLIWLQ